MDKRLCQLCNSPIVGRADKKFCDHQCRNDFNNRNNAPANKLVRNTNRILKKNRRILKELTPQNKEVKVPVMELSKRGFSFDYFTNAFTTETNKTYHFCYDYGYAELDEMHCALIRKE